VDNTGGKSSSHQRHWISFRSGESPFNSGWKSAFFKTLFFPHFFPTRCQNTPGKSRSRQPLPQPCVQSQPFRTRVGWGLFFSRFDRFLAHKLKDLGEFLPLSRKLRPESPNGHSSGAETGKFGQPGGWRAPNPPQIRPEAEFALADVGFSSPLCGDIYACESSFWGENPKKHQSWGRSVFFFRREIQATGAVAHGWTPTVTQQHLSVAWGKTASPKKGFFLLKMKGKGGKIRIKAEKKK